MEESNLEILIKQILKHSKNRKILKIGKKIILNPIEFDSVNDTAQIIINNPIYLEYLLEEYINTIKNSGRNFSPFNERYGRKYYLSCIWKNATNFDYDNPEIFIKRNISFLKDKTFENLDNIYIIGSLGNINGIQSNIYVKRSECNQGYETPFEINIYIGDINNLETLYKLPVIRYGIENDVAYIYAVQNNKNPIITEYDQNIDEYLRKINNNTPGAKNRGVHSASFITALIIFIGMLKSQGISKLLVADILNGRRKDKNRFNIMTEEELDIMQKNITDKLLKTFTNRIADDFDDIYIHAYPNDVDSFLHMFLGNNIHSNNLLLDELFKIGYSITDIKNNMQK